METVEVVRTREPRDKSYTLLEWEPFWHDKVTALDSGEASSW